MDAELSAIQNQLKRILKEKKLSYAQVAEHLGISEVTIKRFFTGKDLSFSKLQQICSVIGISAMDLLSMLSQGPEQTFHLSYLQEKVLSEDETLYDFFVFLLKRKSLQEARQHRRFANANVTKYLRILEQIQLVKRADSDRVEVKPSGTLTWLKGGPLQKAFMRKRHLRYLDALESPLDQEASYFTSSQRLVKKETLDEMKRDLEFIAQKYRARAYREEMIHEKENLVPVAWMIGVCEHLP